MSEQEQIRDPHTGEWFTPKRSNQKFANRQNQIAYNNSKAKQKRRLAAPFSKSIKNNYDILLRILGDGDTAECNMDFLSGAGYELRVMSGFIDDNGMNYQMVFDIGIHKNDDGILQIKKFNK